MHQSVLVNDVLALLAPRRGGLYVDGTLGAGGHADAVMRSVDGDARLLGIDQDVEALAYARDKLSVYGERCVCVHGNYAEMAALAAAHGFERVDGVLLDVGVSSLQLDTARRGFSFREDADLDMRMDQGQGLTAADFLARLSEEEIRRVLREYGEERRARAVAAAIVRQRREHPIVRTLDLAELVERVLGRGQGRCHAATRTFQALRILVNDELAMLERGLEAGLNLLKEGGRMAVISFHSLEDRIVKHTFRRHAGRWISLQAGGARWEGNLPVVRVLTKRPVMPGDDEIEQNVRSRSAKLRAVERLAPDAVAA